jgi:tetratricopeptide (TPR) repeat protein
MMRFLLTITVLITVFSTSTAQDINEKELEKMVKEAQKMADKVQKDPRYRKALAEEGKENKSKTFPAKNKALPATLPASLLTQAGMSSYIKTLYAAYASRMPASVVAHAQKVSGQLAGNADKMAAAAICSWYNGAMSEAILLSLQAGGKKPEDDLMMNNLGAMLNMGGAALHALPILRTLAHKFPENPMVLNNLGQAYAGVGELDTAMKYLVRCIKKSPYHPEANNTAGQIEKNRGHTTEAIAYFQNALKGGHNPEAVNGLKEIGGKEGYALLPQLGSPVNLPYFNEFKYQLPRECTGPADAPYIKKEHEAFIQFIQELEDAYLSLAMAEEQEAKKIMDEMVEKKQQAIIQVLQTGKLPAAMPEVYSPLNLAAMRKLQDMAKSKENELRDHGMQMLKLKATYDNLILNYKRGRDSVIKEYEEKIKLYDCGEGRGEDCAAIDRLSKQRCEELLQLDNTAQGYITAAKREIQEKQLRYLRWGFNTAAYYGYLCSNNKHSGNATFYHAAAEYLKGLKELAYNPFVCARDKCDERIVEIEARQEADGTASMNCPINLKVPFVIGKIELNCERFSFSAGEGLVFNAEKNFVTKQSTMTLGMGLQFLGGHEWGIFSGELSGSASQSFYIVWDKNNKISDAGMALKVEGGLSTEVKVETQVQTQYGMGQVNVKEEIFKQEAGFGYTLGIHSGWTFNDGSLKALVKSVGGIFKK